jgi:hypothetical protein
MSRNDSRHVSCAKAITRNKSAQPSVRTPISPWWRSMMRPKVFHGTNSITCANSVLPTFMLVPGSFKPASIANWRLKIQIVDTHETLETRASTSFGACWIEINRTLLMFTKFSVRHSRAGALLSGTIHAKSNCLWHLLN